MRWPLAIVIISSLASVLLIVLTAFNLIATNDMRRASCQATAIALVGIADIAEAGIKPVPPVLPVGAPDRFSEVYAKQSEEIERENEELREIILEVQSAQVKLRRSLFCTT
jgi:hypothetical protein